MTPDQFRELCRDASRMATSQPGRIGNLVLSKDKRGESLIREPEMLHAFGRTIDARPQPAAFGIEVPTIGLYRFTPTRSRVRPMAVCGSAIRGVSRFVFGFLPPPLALCGALRGQPFFFALCGVWRLRGQPLFFVFGCLPRPLALCGVSRGASRGQQGPE